MAATSGGTAASLEEDLLSRGHEFTFFQAMRLLCMLVKNGEEGERPGLVRIRPELSLSFPCADVARIEKKGYGYLLTVTFLGLYGHASPLPTFYTEQLLIDSAVESSASRDFLDIINHRFYHLFHECVMKYRLFSRVEEQDPDRNLELLFCLIGLGEPTFRQEVPVPRALLSDAGLLGLRSRSALGLATFLSDALQLPAKVIQCLTRRVPVPVEQQLQLGQSCCTIDVDAVLGCEVADRTTAFRIQLGPLDRKTFSGYLPGTPGRRALDALVSFYVKAPLVWDVELKISAGEAPTAIVGNAVGGRLGWDSWLGPLVENANS